MPPLPSLAGRHLETEGHNLIASCAWLGGPRWALIAETLIMAVLHSEPIGRWHRRVLEEMHGLLAFGWIDDPEDTEAGPIVCLDMDDPRVHACCRHADALGDIVR